MNDIKEGVRAYLEQESGIHAVCAPARHTGEYPLLTVDAREDGAVRLRSEAGEGVGADWDAAVADLRAQASGVVFFDTAEHIVVCDRDLLPQLLRSGVLRPAAQVYFADAFRDVEGLEAYLSAHPSGVTVAQLQSEVTRDA